MEYVAREHYSKFAPFYRVMGAARNHFDDQERVLRNLLTRRHIGNSALILDAACGTGDVLAALIRNGYRKSSGADGSPEMIAEARKLSLLDGIDLRCMRWEELADSRFVGQPYDLVFVLGNSIAHASREALPTIVRSLCDLSTKGGIVAFDFRPWVIGPDGSLIEEGLRPGEYMPQGPVAFEGEQFTLESRCTYQNGRQYKDYRLQPVATNSAGWCNDVAFTLSYTMFTEHDATSWLANAGCHDIVIEQPEGWSYLVADGRRG